MVEKMNTHVNKIKKQNKIAYWLFNCHFWKVTPTRKVLGNFILFHYITSTITAVFFAAIGFSLFVVIEFYNPTIGISIVRVSIVGGLSICCYVYVQWRFINIWFFRKQLKKKIGIEWNKAINTFFWKKLCALWYMGIIGSAALSYAIFALLVEVMVIELNSPCDKLIILPGVVLFLFVVRYIDKQLHIVIDSEDF
jgi:hypothetical protein